MPVIKLLFVPSGELRRLPSHDDRSPTFAELEQHARSFFALGADKPLHFKYVDDEGDVVTVSSDGEVADAFAQARAALRSLKFAVAPRGGDAPPAAARGGRGRGVAVHHGVTCDASGMSPIVGVRYHLPGQDYDLCEQEFAKLDADARAAFVKIERPRRVCGGPRRGGGGGGCEMLGAMLGPIAATVADALEDAGVAAAAARAEDNAAFAGRTPVDVFAQFFDACADAAVADEDALDAELQKAIASSVGGQSSGPSTRPASAPSSSQGPAAPQAPAAPQVPAARPAPTPAAPAASEEKSDDGYVAVSPPPTPKAADAPHVPAVAAATTRFDGELAELASLGFGDDADRNIALLERYNGRVMRVVNAILDMTED